MKKVFIGLAVLLAIIIGVVIYVMGSLDSIIKAAVETYGSEITQADVSLDKVKIEPTSGEGALTGLTVGNPKGFKSDSAFRLGEVSVALDIATVTEDTIVIREIVIDSPEITYELGAGGDNLRALQKNVDDYAAQFASEGGSEEASSADSGGGPKLVIENLYVRGGKIEAVIPGLGGEKKLGASLPEIHLSNIGKDDGGATPGEVVKKVMSAVTSGAGKAVAALNIDAVKGLAKEGVGAAKETVGAAKDTVKKGVSGITGGVKSLFGK
jgi:hypothetical protein